MTDTQLAAAGRVHGLREALREVRLRYDELGRGRTAAIRRCRTAGEVALEGVYWQIAGPLAREQAHLPHVVLLFPLARQVTRERFSFGSHLRRATGDSTAATLRFRRLLDSRERDELDHRLRGSIKLAGGETAVDWGVLGVDILWFFAESDAVRRRWAQDFYAPTSGESAVPSDLSSTPANPNVRVEE